MSRIYPSILRLQVHLLYQQTVTFSKDTNLENVINNNENEQTILTEYFKINETDVDARNYLYRRMYMVNPNEGEKYYLRLLLNHVKGAISFTDLKTVKNYICATFRERNVQTLWDDNFIAMSEDFTKEGITNKQLLINSVLFQIKIVLEQHHKKLSEYNLPQLELPENQI
ncbi:1550_t:CDS:2 [Cetraspora pellucida]|uniref:1550_t:CDS:1 n=1 Tax=Cetraspora pellucida TaxID=1433469 RepID=A0ACA9K4X0_9GLOM|nr:1550_t:CDS:2 [Cetraspora pellucida]